MSSFKVKKMVGESATAQQPKAYTPMSLSLPTEKTKPENDLNKFSIFIYGKQGIGKTSFTAQFPEAFHLMFEPGAKCEEAYQRAPLNWKEVEEYARLLDSSDKFSNVVIDTADLMFHMCSSQVCLDSGVESLKDIGFGDGYTKAANKFREILIKLQRKRGLIILAHDKEKWSDKEGSNDYIIPSTMKTGSETIGKWVDLMGHYYLDTKGEHKLRIRTSLDREAKCRIKGHFKYPDGEEIIDIPMGNNEHEAYENFIKAFNNELKKPEPPKKSFKL